MKVTIAAMAALASLFNDALAQDLPSRDFPAPEDVAVPATSAQTQTSQAIVPLPSPMLKVWHHIYCIQDERFHHHVQEVWHYIYCIQEERFHHHVQEVWHHIHCIQEERLHVHHVQEEQHNLNEEDHHNSLRYF
ncbi:hypothetical protein LZ32DRAFT_658680 [Colletotrichum eremochloae]|nr:hypothetical protein LZ32DRAFT_658680 [Colletotrichum eremochloae]